MLLSRRNHAVKACSGTIRRFLQTFRSTAKTTSMYFSDAGVVLGTRLVPIVRLDPEAVSKFERRRIFLSGSSIEDKLAIFILIPIMIGIVDKSLLDRRSGLLDSA